MAEFNYQFDEPKAAFAEAEKRIQHATKSGAKELGLAQLGLTDLSASFDQARVTTVPLPRPTRLSPPAQCRRIGPA